jgi:hypothetical protein
VAVPLQSLPEWAQHISAFFPGRYAVEAMQLSATGSGLSSAGFDFLALLLMGAGAAIAATGMFRWDKALAPRRGWLFVALGIWLAVGAMAEMRGSVTIGAAQDTRDVGTAKNIPPHLSQQLPGKRSARPISTGSPSTACRPIAASSHRSRAATKHPIPSWSPAWTKFAMPCPNGRPAMSLIRCSGRAICWPSRPVPDILQMEQMERFIPRLVFARLQAVIPPRDLPKVLYWIAMHPDDGDDAPSASWARSACPRSAVPPNRCGAASCYMPSSCWAG